jgi:photosystem II stability/assembly factor-like uncharacterized protein
MTRGKSAVLFVVCCLTAQIASAQLSVVVKDISPDRSNSPDADAASGGRVNKLGVDRSTPARVYAASEFGGLFRSTDNGLNWSHLDGHVPTVTWDVKVDPTNSNRVYATSFYDGRTNSRSGINVSTDGGNTWTHPATATPPVNFCTTSTRRTEPAAFGIAIDPANANHVFIGTNCGLAISLDAGVTWNFVDPTPADRADDIGGVIVHHGGIIDVCGDDGHLRSTDGGTTWTTAATQPLPQGRCSIVASPDESYVLFAVVGTSIFESDDGGQSWPGTYANPSPQGRIPFVATNKRSGVNYDLWFGDVRLFRGTCTTPSPAVLGGAQRCNASPAWAGPFTRTAGAHDDSGDIAFAPGAAANACPLFFSSDGGVFRNTVTTSPGCHTPAWTQPTVTPHSLRNYAFGGVHRAGATPEDLYLSNQDDGTFGTLNAGATSVSWNTENCCDGFGAKGDSTRALTTVCCFSPGRATLLFVSAPGLTAGGSPPQINTYPPGNVRAFEQLESLLTFSANAYAMSTTAGVFATSNIGASPVVWTQLGAANSPASPCGLQVATTAGTPTFYVKSGGCNGELQGTLWRYQGTAGGSTWQQVPAPTGPGGLGVYAVDPNDPQRLIASHLGAPTGPEMVFTSNLGTTWTHISALDTLMTGAGTFKYLNQSGPNVTVGSASIKFNGYPQPTLVAFDPSDPDILVAGSTDSGVFISTNGGTQWQLVTDPISPGTSGTPHIPRPYYAHFDHDPSGGDINLFLGTRGRGAWRLTFKKVPMPQIQVPAPPEFKPSCVGDKRPGTLNVCNTSAGDLVITSITSSNPEFTIVSPSGGFPVTVSHDFCFPFTVIFTPTSVGVQTTTLTIASNDPSTPSVTVQATAKAGKGLLGLSAAEVFNPTVIQSIGKCHSSRPLVVSNTGTCDLTITDITIGGANASDYSLSGLPAFPVTLEPGHTVGSGDLNAVFAPTDVARERIAQATVTFVSDPTTGATSTQTSALCGEGVRTGARVLVTQGGVPIPQVHEIELKRLHGGWFGFAKEVDEVKKVPLQTVTPTPGTACPSFQFHREYGAASNPDQLVPGVYQLKVEAIIGGKEVRKKTWFKVDTCGFNGTIIVDF